VTIPGSSLTRQHERGALTLRRDVQFPARGSRPMRDTKSRTRKTESMSISRPSPVRSNPALAVLWVGCAMLGAYVIASQASNLDSMIATSLVGDIIEGHARGEGRDR